jgi:hypothetical protein
MEINSDFNLSPINAIFGNFNILLINLLTPVVLIAY